jgi:hypothetical protein
MSGGERSLFNKLIGRETAEARRHGESHCAKDFGQAEIAAKTFEPSADTRRSWEVV